MNSISLIESYILMYTNFIKINYIHSQNEIENIIMLNKHNLLKDVKCLQKLNKFCTQLYVNSR
jgi:hypothetical protein